MRSTELRRTAVTAVLALAVTGCAPTNSRTTDSAPAHDTAARPSGRDVRERITPSGIAGVVLEHLGPDTVRRFLTFEQEPGSVSVMVRLRDATPHNFGVQVFAPDQADALGVDGRCPSEDGPGGTFRCRVLPDGTVVTTIEEDYGFSDDNEDGVVVSASAVTAEDGAVLALYESYDDTPAISAAELEELATDPRLTWRTDPAVNEAGESIDIRRIDG